MRAGLVALALGVAVVVAGSGAASAQSKTQKADALFKKGKKLLEEGKFADACKSFEESQEMEPAVGTQLNIGLCYEQWGKLATAWRAYEEALRQAAATKDDRAPRIKGRVDQIEPRVPTLIVKAPGDGKAPVGANVTIDGKPMPIEQLGQKQRLDPGEHVIEYAAGKSAKKRLTVLLKESQTEEAVLVALTDMAAGGPVEEFHGEDGDKVDPPPPPPPRSGRRRRIIALVVAGGGVVSMGVSTILVLGARSDYRDAVDQHCNAANQCDPIGLDATQSARTRANVATIFFGIGAAAVATGAVLWFTAPSGDAPKDDQARWIAPVVGGDTIGVAVGGSL